jgi:hypothetical protein
MTTKPTSEQVTFLAAGSGATQRTVLDKLRDVVSVKDFGAVGDGVADDTAAVQAFFNHLQSADYGLAVIDGVFRVTSALTLTNPLTKVIVGDCQFVAASAIANVLTISGFNWGYWERLSILGTGSTSFASRTCNTGLRLVASGRVRFGFLKTDRFAFAGVCCDSGNSNMTDLGHVTAQDCGSGASTYSLTGSWSSPVNTGTTGSTNQRTAITVTQLPPSFILNNDYGTIGAMSIMVRIGGQLYWIDSIDQGLSTLTVYPWLPSTATPGSFEYVFGGGVFLRGADTNVFGMSMVDVTRCGIGLCVNSLYGPNVRRVVTQFCGTGIVIGATPSSAMIGGHFDGAYFEGNSEDIFVTQFQGSAGYNYFGAEYALDLSKCSVLAPRLTSNALSESLQTFSRTPMMYQGFRKQHLFGKSANNYTGSIITLSPHHRSGDLVYFVNSPTVSLQSIDLQQNRMFGEDSAKIVFFGTGANSAPTGTITFNAPSGWTVNGGATATFSGLTAPGNFAVYWNISSTNVVVALI